MSNSSVLKRRETSVYAPSTSPTQKMSSVKKEEEDTGLEGRDSPRGRQYLNSLRGDGYYQPPTTRLRDRSW